MPKIILTIGASCSGKTTWAEKFCGESDNFINLNRDDVRFELFTNNVRDWTKYKFNKTKQVYFPC